MALGSLPEKSRADAQKQFNALKRRYMSRSCYFSLIPHSHLFMFSWYNTRICAMEMHAWSGLMIFFVYAD